MRAGHGQRCSCLKSFGPSGSRRGRSPWCPSAVAVATPQGWPFARAAELSSTQAPTPDSDGARPPLDAGDLPAAAETGRDPPEARGGPGSRGLCPALLLARVLPLSKDARDGFAQEP